MSARSFVFEKPRIGLEDITTPGVPVRTDMVFLPMTIIATPNLPRNIVKASGNKFGVATVAGKEWTSFTYDMPATYNELAFVLANVFCVPTSVGGLLSYRIDATNPSPMRTWTIEAGSTAGAARFPGAYLDDISFSFTEKEAKVSGKGMAQVFTDVNVLLTASPTAIPLVPIDMDAVSIYVADTYAGLSAGSARLKLCKSATFSLAGRQTAIFTLDDSAPSYSTTVEKKDTTYQAQIVLAQDSQGDALMARMRARNVPFFVKYEAIGAGGRRFMLAFACYITATQRGDVDDLYAGTYDLTLCFVDGTALAGGAGSVYAEITTADTVTTLKVMSTGVTNTTLSPTVGP